MIRSTCPKEGKETGERIDRNGKLWRHHGKKQWLEKAVFVQSLLWQNTWASSLQRIKGLCWPSLSELNPRCSAPLFLSFRAAEGYGGNHVVELHLIVKGERGGKGGGGGSQSQDKGVYQWVTSSARSQLLIAHPPVTSQQMSPLRRLVSRDPAVSPSRDQTLKAGAPGCRESSVVKKPWSSLRTRV